MVTVVLVMIFCSAQPRGIGSQQSGGKACVWLDGLIALTTMCLEECVSILCCVLPVLHLWPQ